MTQLRKGRFTNEERDFIKQNCSKLTPTELAKKLSRDPESIRAYITKNGYNIRGEEEHKDYAAHSLISSEHWNTLKMRYNSEEQEMFKSHYSEIVGQFQNEVPYTELLQIIDYIHLEIEIQRASVLKKNVTDAILRLNKDVARLRKIGTSDDEIVECEDLLCQKEASLKTMHSELTNLLDRKEKFAKSLKATREQRVARIESAKKTFAGYIANLIDNPERMREVGIEIEKHRLATDAEYMNLHNLHSYADGELDPPILNADSVQQINRIDTQEQEQEKEQLSNDSTA